MELSIPNLLVILLGIPSFEKTREPIKPSKIIGIIKFIDILELNLSFDLYLIGFSIYLNVKADKKKLITIKRNLISPEGNHQTQ